MDEDIAASLEAFANRKIYARLDPQTLRSVADADVEQAVIDYVISNLDGHYDEEIEIIGALSPGVRATYLTWIVEAEVNNGALISTTSTRTANSRRKQSMPLNTSARHNTRRLSGRRTRYTRPKWRKWQSSKNAVHSRRCQDRTSTPSSVLWTIASTASLRTSVNCAYPAFGRYLSSSLESNRGAVKQAVAADGDPATRACRKFHFIMQMCGALHTWSRGR